MIIMNVLKLTMIIVMYNILMHRSSQITIRYKEECLCSDSFQTVNPQYTIIDFNWLWSMLKAMVCGLNVQ